MAALDEHIHSALAVDGVVFGVEEEDLDRTGNEAPRQLHVLLIRRRIAPFKGKWALPGGFVREDETLEQAAVRELHEETGLSEVFLEPFKTFSRVDRDPRGRVISAVFTATVTMGERALRATADAQDVAWFAIEDLPPLAFDHAVILEEARQLQEPKYPYCYQYPRGALTVDCVVFGLDAEGLKVLLIQRGQGPFKDHWALPGGFVRVDEEVDEAAGRELQEETGIDRKKVFLEQLYTIGGPLDRDPRERVVTVAYYALVKLSDHRIAAATDAKNADWFPAAELPALAFDHRRIVDLARERLRGKVRYQPIGFELLPRRFTLTQLQHVYETILEETLDKRNFRRKVLDAGFLEALDEFQKNVAHRAARLYRFDKKEYKRLEREGFGFRL